MGQKGGFRIFSDFKPTGDQPQAIDQLFWGLGQGYFAQTLLGVTGSGKTFTMANVIQKVDRPALVICHNKTLAAQLYAEFKEFFPHHAVEYFVSYYDYYQPEAYIPHTDTYIEKETEINEEIDRLRLAATSALSSRQDVVIVASVSCIYGLGEPSEYHRFVLNISKGGRGRGEIIQRLVGMQYERNDIDFCRGRFRLRGDTLEVIPSHEERIVRVSFFGDEVEKICITDRVSGRIAEEIEEVDIYPAKHFVTSEDRLKAAIGGIQAELEDRVSELQSQDKLVEAQRLKARTRYDIEMMLEVGYCNGIENYSRHLEGRPPGSPPWTLLDYFPGDFITFIDESHMTLPQLRGMYYGDRSRKQTLVDYGFRLPSALDHRPLCFEEFMGRLNQVIFISATPADFEYQRSSQVVEQLVRPTGLLEPEVEIRGTTGQIDDLMGEIRRRVDKGERCLVTTLTKRMAEELSEYLLEMRVKAHYLHSEVNTLDRVEILRDLRLGAYDVIVGINLLREGLDLPEVSLVAILDADKEGYLRSKQALIQTMGRAARHVEGKAILYADQVTSSMGGAISEVARRRKVQEDYNRRYSITPEGIKKEIRDITQRIGRKAKTISLEGKEISSLIAELELEMKKAAQDLEFERAALLRDKIYELRKGESKVEVR